MDITEHNSTSRHESADSDITDNVTDDVTEDVTEYFYQVEQLTFLWILFFLIVIGNATVLIALIVSKGRKSRMNFFIKHLAAAGIIY